MRIIIDQQILGGNLYNEEFDAHSSAYRFAEQCEKAFLAVIAKEYPGEDDVIVRQQVEPNCSGYSRALSAQIISDDGEAEAPSDDLCELLYIAKQEVYESFDWLVEELAQDLPIDARQRAEQAVIAKTMSNELSSTTRDEIVARVTDLLREEWELGSSGLPGFHHQPAAMTAAEIAAIIFK